MTPRPRLHVPVRVGPMARNRESLLGLVRPLAIGRYPDPAHLMIGMWMMMCMCLSARGSCIMGANSSQSVAACSTGRTVASRATFANRRTMAVSSYLASYSLFLFRSVCTCLWERGTESTQQARRRTSGTSLAPFAASSVWYALAHEEGRYCETRSLT